MRIGAGVAVGLALSPWAWAAGEKYAVPYTVSGTRHFLVRARVNGEGPYNFVLDTGAPGLFVAKDVAGKLGVEAGMDGWATFDRLEIEGGPVLEKVQGRVEDPAPLRGMNAMGIAGTRLDGVLGYNILARFRLTLDPTRRHMTWVTLDHEPPAPQSVRSLAGGKPVTPPPGMKALEGLTDLTTSMRPRAAAAPPVQRGFFGLELVHGSGPATVRAALAGGPAARAGLRAGDVVTGVVKSGEKPVPVASGGALWRALAKTAAGEEVVLTVRRGGKRVRRTVKAGEGL